MVANGSDLGWCPGVVAWGCGQGGWHEVVAGGSVNEGWQWGVSRGGGEHMLWAPGCEVISRAWQKRFLSARESKLIRIHVKFGVPSSLSMMLI